MSSSNEYLLPFFLPPALPAAPNCSKFSLDLAINEVEALCAEKWVVPVESNESDAAYFVPTRFRMPTTSVGDILEIAHCLLKPGRLLGINLLVSPLWRKYVISLVASHMLIPVSDTIFKANTSPLIFVPLIQSLGVCIWLLYVLSKRRLRSRLLPLPVALFALLKR